MEQIADAFALGKRISTIMESISVNTGIRNALRTIGHVEGVLTFTSYYVYYMVTDEHWTEEIPQDKEGGFIYAIGIVNTIVKVLERICTDPIIKKEMEETGQFTGKKTISHYRVNFKIVNTLFVKQIPQTEPTPETIDAEVTEVKE